MGFYSFRLSDEINLESLCNPITCWVIESSKINRSVDKIDTLPVGLQASSRLRGEGQRGRFMNLVELG